MSRHPSSRAHRRHHRSRVIATRRNKIPWVNSSLEVSPEALDSQRASARVRSGIVLGRLAKTPTPCSCWACGNPRRHRGERTRAERSVLALMEETRSSDPPSAA